MLSFLKIGLLILLFKCDIHGRVFMTNINGVKVLLLHNLKNKNEKNQKVLTTYMNYLVNSQRFEVRPPLGKFTS